MYMFFFFDYFDINFNIPAQVLFKISQFFTVTTETPCPTIERQHLKKNFSQLSFYRPCTIVWKVIKNSMNFAILESP